MNWYWNFIISLQNHQLNGQTLPELIGHLKFCVDFSWWPTVIITPAIMKYMHSKLSCQDWQTAWKQKLFSTATSTFVASILSHTKSSSNISYYPDVYKSKATRQKSSQLDVIVTSQLDAWVWIQMLIKSTRSYFGTTIKLTYTVQAKEGIKSCSTKVPQLILHHYKI